MFFAIVGWRALQLSFNSTQFIVLFKLSIFLDIMSSSVFESEALMSPTIAVICFSFEFSQLCFTCFVALLLQVSLLYCYVYLFYLYKLLLFFFSNLFCFKVSFVWYQYSHISSHVSQYIFSTLLLSTFCNLACKVCLLQTAQSWISCFSSTLIICVFDCLILSPCTIMDTSEFVSARRIFVFYACSLSQV